jgi:DNA-binding Xre family transcriptional regulator
MKKFKTIPSEREKKIRILLLERNMTSKTLAEALGISEPLLTYKLREDAWKVEDIEKLIKFFKIKPSELLDLTGKMDVNKKQ